MSSPKTKTDEKILPEVQYPLLRTFTVSGFNQEKRICIMQKRYRLTYNIQ